MISRLVRGLARPLVRGAFLSMLLAVFATAAQAQPVLTTEMLTWHIVGLDSNNPLTQGPNEFLSGVRVCNSGADPANNVEANYLFDSANPYINLSPRGTGTLTTPFLLPGDCEDFYFLLRVTRTPLAYNTTRLFHIEISADNHATVSTPTPRELFVEKLISQNRNDVISISGPTEVFVGQTATYTVISKTATQGYEQLSSFLDFPNLLFRVLSVDASYSAPPGATNDRIYADACGWDDVPGPTPPGGTYRACAGPADYPGGKAGGNVTTVYTVQFASAGDASLTELIYDFSGSSFHYNADLGVESIQISIDEQVPYVQINKHCDPDPVSPDTDVVCTIEYANNSVATTLTGVEILDIYDPRTTYVSAVPAPDNAPDNNHWSIGTLAPGDYGVITVTMHVDAAANDGDLLLNRVTIHDDVAAANDSPGDPPGVFADDEALLHVAEDEPGTALLRVAKTGIPDPEVGAGSPITYTIQYRNDGQATAYAVVLTDTLGAGLAFVSSLPAPATSSAPVYTWNLGDLAPGASGNITLTVITDTGLTSGTLVENDVLLEGQPGVGTLDTEGLTAYAEEIQFVRGGAQAQADLSITKVDGTDPVAQGATVAYTINVANAGPDLATGVTVTDVLDTFTTFIASSVPCVESPTDTLSCDLGDMAAGANTSFTITVGVDPTAPTAGTLQVSPCTGAEDLCNVATVSAASSDPDPGDNSSDEPTNVTVESDICDISVTKVDTADPVVAGGTLTYSIMVTNNGPSNASDVIIRDELDEFTAYVSDTFPSSCSLEPPNTVVCHYSSIPAGQSRTRTITVSVDADAPSAGSLQTGACDGSEDLCNRIVSTSASGCADTDFSDNMADEPSNVSRPSSDVSITKTDTLSDPVVQGGTVTYTITVGNAGPAAADDVVVVDTLDSDTTFISDTAPGGCIESPAGTLTCNVGTLANAGNASFDVTVLVGDSAPTAGTTQSGTCASPGVDICNSATVSSYSDDPDPSDNTAQQPTNVLASSADLSIEKSDAGYDPVSEGGVFTYTLTVGNAGPDAATNVVVADVLDANEFYLADTATGGCIEAPAGTLNCSLGNIGNGAVVAFDVTVFVPTGAPTGGTLQDSPCDASEDLCNDAAVSASTPDPVPANNADDEPTDVAAAQADLSITKSDAGSDPVAAGGSLVYTIHVENPGPADAQDVVVVDTLDPETTYVSDDFGCVEAPAGTLTCDLGALLVGQSQDIEVTVSVSPTAPDAGTLQVGPCDGSEDLCNEATVSSSTSDPDPSDNSDDEPTNVDPVIVPSANLSVEKADPGSSVSRGDNLTYTITVANGGPSDASNVVVTDTLDAGTTYVSDTGGCVEAPAGTLTCTFATVASGDSEVFTVTVLVGAGAGDTGTLETGVCNGSEDLCNSVSVDSDTSDPDGSDNSDDEPTDVLPEADLSIVKDGPATIVPGIDAVYTIIVTNNGPSAADSVSVADPTPAGLTFDSNTGDCVTPFPCALGTIASGGTRTITATYTVPASYTAPDPVENTATVSSSTDDPDPSDNSSTDSSPVEPSADVSIAKSDPGSSVERGDNLTYTLSVTNTGPSDADNVVVTDTLDPNTTYVSDTAGCVQAPIGTLTCTFTTLAAGDAENFSVTVLVGAGAPDAGTLETGACNGSEDLCNTASAASDTTDPDATDNTDTEPTDVLPTAASADVSIAKADLDSPVQAGAFASYSITVTNDGPDAAADVVVVDTLPAGAAFVASTRPCTEGPAGTLTCGLGTLADSASVVFEVIVHVDPLAATAGTASGSPCVGGEDLCNLASVSSATDDPDPSNNSADAGTDVIAAATISQLTLTKIDIGAEPALPGSDVTYEIEVANAGPDDATDVVVYETLDPFMTYGSDTAGCVVTDPGDGVATGASLTCPLGTIASGSSTSFQIVVTVSPSSPVNSGQQDGDCAGTEDVCNEAVVATSSADFTIADNDDSEPTDVSAGVACGNGGLDQGEQCDPPSSEICNNTVDDDGDLQIDCLDVDCIAPGFQSCDGNCQLTTPCVPILNDPAHLRWDRVKIHGKFIPTTEANPLLDGFVFLVANADGEVFRAELLEGDLKVVGGTRLLRWAFRDNAARSGNGVRGGLYRVYVKQRRERDGQISYPFKIKAFGDMSKAITSRMTTQVYLDDDVAFLTATWLGEPGRWRLTQRQASAGLPGD